jgi:hypothetical protein
MSVRRPPATAQSDGLSGGLGGSQKTRSLMRCSACVTGTMVQLSCENMSFPLAVSAGTCRATVCLLRSVSAI